MAYCLYLRKSRADAMPHGAYTDTLSQHEQALTSLAERLALPIEAIYREVVSGEQIAARPMMQQLLNEVSNGQWDGVLVMEIERLARGDTIDQGIVAQTFKYSNTLIITPQKIFDPQNEFDEEYFEFGLFMSRREYKTIHRRMQRGRTLGAMEGRYTGSRAPYGYVRERLDGKGFKLCPHPVQAGVVRMIYQLYTDGQACPDGTVRRLGPTLIAKRLNALGIPAPSGGCWSVNSLRDMLRNPVYAGRIRYNHRPRKKAMESGRLTVARPRNDACILVDGLHEAIVPKELFERAQERIVGLPRLRSIDSVQNPLCGLIVCARCGRKLIRRSYPTRHGQRERLLCPNPACSNVSIRLSVVEHALVEALMYWYDGYQIIPTLPQTKPKDHVLLKARQSLMTKTLRLINQRNHLFDLLERGVYDDAIYRSRKKHLDNSLQKIKAQILHFDQQIQESEAGTRTPHETSPVPLMDVYPKLGTAQKNEFLKALLVKAVYQKDGRGKNVAFTLTLYPRLPRFGHHPCPNSSVPMSVSSARV